MHITSSIHSESLRARYLYFFPSRKQDISAPRYLRPILNVRALTKLIRRVATDTKRAADQKKRAASPSTSSGPSKRAKLSGANATQNGSHATQNGPIPVLCHTFKIQFHT